MIRKTIAVASTLVAMAMVGPAFAHAYEQGGDGNAADCKDAYVVASRPITGERGPTKGNVIGYLELRWSWQCHANWARVVLFGGLYSSSVTVRQEITVAGRTAISEDGGIYTGENGTSAWTRYVRPENPESAACVQASVSSDFGTLNFHTVGTHFCV
ncbi:DUF2690 domain-containing protein [Nocardia bovistercoris]|nr:DUF2690 domain-containing protein [Nocardia bovistercoris]